MSCVSCGNADLVPYIQFKAPVSVSSDCKPLNFAHPIVLCEHCGLIQKQLSDVYFDNITTLYREYNPYPLTNGAEGVNFGGEVPQSRCLSILENVQGLIPNSGKWLDMGTGSGVMPRSLINLFHSRYAIWCQDLNDKYRASLESIPEISGFIEGSIASSTQHFDVISLVHVLEHIVDPLSFLKEIKAKLNAGGMLIIQVPDIATNPLDFSIYDHIAHFTKDSLSKLVSQVFPEMIFPETQLDKELTLVASVAANRQDLPLSKKRISHEQIKTSFSTFEKNVIDIKKDVLVFGTGPSSIYTASLLGQYCAGWVDEDPAKLGKNLLGKDIYSVDDYPAGYDIVLPFLSPQREKILTRLAHLNWLN